MLFPLFGLILCSFLSFYRIQLRRQLIEEWGENYWRTADTENEDAGAEDAEAGEAAKLRM